MKKYVRAAESQYESAFAEAISVAGNRGYDLKVSDNLKVMLVAKTNIDEMPTITVDTVDVGDMKYRFYCKLEFPTLEQEDSDDPDSIAAILDKWQKIGDLITTIQEIEIDANQVIDTEE